MDYKEFKKIYEVSNRDISREVYRNNKGIILIKKEKTAVNNLEKIFNAVFNISYKKGFQAMSMRALSQKTGMSLGSLYAYFKGKEDLQDIIQIQGWSIIKKDLEKVLKSHNNPWERLKAVIKAHVFLSELFRPWFYFTFMEARNIKAVKSMEDHTQKILTNILVEGEKQGVFKLGNHELTASMIKAMQQEWYLKRWKYKKLNISVDQFAGHLMGLVEAFCLAPGQEGCA
ncbi:MAG: TetR/AcrR family transcriptional regulator [Desulfobacula sp.]|uniref:TetR/AcrR family transcriptional regulator n=1 Tax=Desulfobacula sp. TaxID=2593537 RepID=UPI002A072BAE|nr:TetR/AcrR family transcriptional regulator [Desulfobacula sp.]MBT6749835.1 TetR/AcrR family transcriptional regulator [Desulfobacula sp.]